MDNRYERHEGGRIQTEQANSSAPITVTSVTATTARIHQRNVINAGSISGNRKDANPIEFWTADWQYLRGEISSSIVSIGRYYRSTGYFGAPSASGPITSITDKLADKVLGDLYENIRGQVDLAVALAEAGSTARMLRSSLKLVSYVRSFHPKRWGQKWLEYQYGWRPLMQDVYNAGQQLQKELPRMTRTKSRATYKKSTQRAIPYSAVPGSFELVKEEFSERFLIDIQWEIPDSVMVSLGNWSSLNPASIAWELVPFSFVVDWVYDVGGYLRNLESALLYANSFKSGYKTYGTKLSSTHDVNAQTFTAPYTNNVSLHGYHYSSWKKRMVLTGTPLPRPPSFKADLGSQRLLSAASLLSLHLKVTR